MLDWLLASIDQSRPHDIELWQAWHGRIMTLAWCFLLPLGVFFARFFKIMPKQNFPKELDNRTWWWGHQICQYGGFLFMGLALYFVWDGVPKISQFNHHQWMGWSIFFLCGLQVLSGLLRGKKGGPSELAKNGTIRGAHYDMTRQRILFEIFHKTVGYLCLLLAAATIITGLWHVNAPHFMWIGVPAWWLLLIALFYYLQRKKMCVDTYQAIWGIDPNLPGEKIDPIGFGITRYKQNKAD